MTTPMIKITFPLVPDGWNPAGSETLWATPVAGTESNIAAVLQNSPFYAKGVSYLDTVKVMDGGGYFRFDGIVKRGGHSTFRILTDHGTDSDLFHERWNGLRELGCSYEAGAINGQNILSVDVPASTDINRTYALLSQGEDEGTWTFEEGHLGHEFRTAT